MTLGGMDVKRRLRLTNKMLAYVLIVFMALWLWACTAVPPTMTVYIKG